MPGLRTSTHDWQENLATAFADDLEAKRWAANPRVFHEGAEHLEKEAKLQIHGDDGWAIGRRAYIEEKFDTKICQIVSGHEEGV